MVEEIGVQYILKLDAPWGLIVVSQQWMESSTKIPGESRGPGKQSKVITDISLFFSVSHSPVSSPTAVLYGTLSLTADRTLNQNPDTCV